MPSSEQPPNPIPAPSGYAAFLKGWNRRLHYFLGLYFLFFIWLFALTGLLLNHGSWQPAESLANRTISSETRAIQAPAAGTSLEQARDLMRQLDLAGEIQWPTTPANPRRLEFRAVRPGVLYDIKADMDRAEATVQRTETGAWSTALSLHSFTGVRATDTRNRRDWILTTTWVLAMDALALGLGVLVLGGLILWLGLKGKRISGSIALGAGVFAFGWFIVGLRWMFV